MIRVRNLVKNYDQSQAVRGISFEMGLGQVVGFLGPNGAGKSTTMKMLMGYVTPTSGSIEIPSLDKIGYLPENNPLYDDMMVVEYLDFVLRVRCVAQVRRCDMIEQASRRCALSKVMRQDIGTLSRGFRQRVGVAQAIVHDPVLLILDEPTSGLDPNQIIEMRDLIKDLGKQKTILMSTHILSEAQATCSRILIMNEGLIVADDTPEQLAAEVGGLEGVFQRLKS